tara:strand:+ start:385 stop:771 length:387 start_codon:yes stop_codon:yes gene_type:complete
LFSGKLQTDIGFSGTGPFPYQLRVGEPLKVRTPSTTSPQGCPTDSGSTHPSYGMVVVEVVVVEVVVVEVVVVEVVVVEVVVVEVEALTALSNTSSESPSRKTARKITSPIKIPRRASNQYFISYLQAH